MSTISNAILRVHILCHYNKKTTNNNRHENDIQLKHSNRECNSFLDSAITTKYIDGVSINLIWLSEDRVK